MIPLSVNFFKSFISILTCKTTCLGGAFLFINFKQVAESLKMGTIFPFGVSIVTIGSHFSFWHSSFKSFFDNSPSVKDGTKKLFALLILLKS